MSDVQGFILIMVLALILVLVHTFLATYSEYRDAIQAEIEKDEEEFGYCCGLESGHCTYQPKLDKINKADKHHKQNKK